MIFITRHFQFSLAAFLSHRQNESWGPKPDTYLAHWHPTHTWIQYTCPGISAHFTHEGEALPPVHTVGLDGLPGKKADLKNLTRTHHRQGFEYSYSRFWMAFHMKITILILYIHAVRAPATRTTAFKIERTIWFVWANHYRGDVLTTNDGVGKSYVSACFSAVTHIGCTQQMNGGFFSQRKEVIFILVITMESLNCPHILPLEKCMTKPKTSELQSRIASH